MLYKLICQLDDFGYFLHQSTAEESPLEPGVFLIPRNALDIPPPEYIEGKRARYVNGQWVYEDSLTHYPDMQFLRKVAYQEEADPLFFKSQRGEATKQEWLDKIKEIRNRFPYKD